MSWAVLLFFPDSVNKSSRWQQTREVELSISAEHVLGFCKTFFRFERKSKMSNHKQCVLAANRYGKVRVRLFRVNRSSHRHKVTEMEVNVMLEGFVCLFSESLFSHSPRESIQGQLLGRQFDGCSNRYNEKHVVCSCSKGTYSFY
jgi:hypothetical protein